MVEGAYGHRTHIFVAYLPSSHNLNVASTLLTVYQQQVNYVRNTHTDKIFPRKLFRDNLISAFATWSKEGDRLIIFINSTDCLKSEKCVTQLKQHVDMDDLVNRRTGKDGFLTYIKGEKEGTLQIDGCFRHPWH